MTNFVKTLEVSLAFCSAFAITDSCACLYVPQKSDAIYKIDMDAVNKNYDVMSKDYGISKEALRGDYFEPREFWSQPISTVLKTLAPELKKHDIPYAFYPVHDALKTKANDNVKTKLMGTYTLIPNKVLIDTLKITDDSDENLSRTYPLDLEKAFEKAVLERINKFMKSKKLQPIDDEKFFASLKTGRGGNQSNAESSAALAAPLFTYFDAYYTFSCVGLYGSPVAEFIVKEDK